MSASILTPTFAIVDQGIAFDVSARGHRDDDGVHVDDVTVLGAHTAYWTRLLDLNLNVEDDLFCERRLRQLHSGEIVAALERAERDEGELDAVLDRMAKA